MLRGRNMNGVKVFRGDVIGTAAGDLVCHEKCQGSRPKGAKNPFISRFYTPSVHDMVSTVRVQPPPVSLSKFTSKPIQIC